jgi:hypothetical protein
MTEEDIVLIMRLIREGHYVQWRERGEYKHTYIVIGYDQRYFYKYIDGETTKNAWEDTFPDEFDWVILEDSHERRERLSEEYHV